MSDYSSTGVPSYSPIDIDDLSIVAIPHKDLPQGKGRFYRPELDILRFGAFLLVYESHTVPVGPGSSAAAVALRSSGALGVPLFFMLSAFLITELLLREKVQSGTVNIKAFYVRRVLRIWPLYFGVILLGFLLSHMPGRPHPMSMSALASYLLLVGNLWTAAHGYLPSGLVALWSISIEEQYYLVWPSLVRAVSVKKVGTVCVAVWIVSQATLLVLCRRHTPMNPAVWCNSIVQFQYFALGGMLAVMLRGRIPSLAGWVRAAAAAAGLLLIFVANYAFEIQPFAPSSIRETYFGYLIAGPAALLLLIAALGATPYRWTAPAIWLGKISYGLYVFHESTIFLMLALSHRVLRHGSNSALFVVVTSFPLTAAIAALSYRYFETPFLRIKERFTVVRSRAI